MDIVYYTHPAFFEPALCLVRALSTRARVHLLLELSPAGWRSAAFDAAPRQLPPGLVPADEVLAEAFPAGVRDCWRAAATFHLVVHPARRSLHPTSWRISRQALRFMGDLHADVLHVDDVDVSPRLATALATSGSPLPLVIAVHDPEPHAGEHNWRKQLARRLAYPRARAFVLYNAAARSTFATRHHLAASAVHATRLGVYDILRAWSAGDVPRSNTTVLFFGRLSQYKGLEVFYEAMPAIAARVPGCKFVVAGGAVPGYTLPAPPPVAHGARVETITRYLSTAETTTLFRQATVVVCPYTDATQSGVVLTAYAFGVPVVATAVGGLPEYVIADQTGLLVAPRDPRALADAVTRVLTDAALRERLRARVEAVAPRAFSWDDTADALMRVYTSVSA